MATVTEHNNNFAAPPMSKASDLNPAEAVRQGTQNDQASWVVLQRGWKKSKADSGFSIMERLCLPGTLLHCCFESSLKVLAVKSTVPQQ